MAFASMTLSMQCGTYSGTHKLKRSSWPSSTPANGFNRTFTVRQRMMLQLQRYQLEVSYRPGKEMLLADALSRAQLATTERGLSKRTSKSWSTLSSRHYQLPPAKIEGTAPTSHSRRLRIATLAAHDTQRLATKQQHRSKTSQTVLDYSRRTL